MSRNYVCIRRAPVKTWPMFTVVIGGAFCRKGQKELRIQNTTMLFCFLFLHHLFWSKSTLFKLLTTKSKSGSFLARHTTDDTIPYQGTIMQRFLFPFLTQMFLMTCVFQIYMLYLNLIVNICLPFCLLVAMNICIYRTMRSQWYSRTTAAGVHANAPGSPPSTSNQNDQHNGDHEQQHHNSRKSITSFVTSIHKHHHHHHHHHAAGGGSGGRRKSSCGGHETSTTGAASGVTTSTIRRVGGATEAESKKRDSKYTRASVVMVVAFVVCNAPRFVPNIMELFVELKDFPEVEYTPEK